MKPLKFIALSIIAILFASCKASQPAGPSSDTSGPSVGDVISTLMTTESKCYDLIKANPGSSPQQIIMLTAAWLQTQPNVQGVEVLDSLTINIALKSGLATVYQISLTDANGIALTRGGGGPKNRPLRFGTIVPAQHALTNKNVLIYSPCVNNDDGSMRSGVGTALYQEGEIDTLVNIFKKANQGFNVTVVEGDTLGEINSFGNYGIVFIETHGLPWGFLSGAVVSGPVYDTAGITFTLKEAEIKELMDGSWAGPGTYEGLQNGSLRAARCKNWADFLKVQCCNYIMNVFVTSKYITSLPSMSNTIIIGNFCYSGWNNDTSKRNPAYAAINDPVYGAFTSLNPLAYYSYGYPDGTSSVVDNTFAKRMEDSLAQALVIYGDSTGFAYKMADGSQYTARKLGVGNYSLDMPFNHYGPDNYSYPPDSMVDPRDGQVYKIVRIDSQTWMAQNLNYNAAGSMCYDNDPRNGAILGRLYPWYVAMDGAPSDSSNPGKVQGVCPKGWHIPSLSEWNQLFVATGGISSFSKSGNALESPLRDTSAGGWLPSTINFTPSNSSGFSALPGGGFFWDTTSPPLGTPTFHFVGKSQQGFFLTSTLVPAGQVWAGRVNAITFGINGTVSVIQRQGNPDDPIDPYQPSMNASCRCVKDP